MKGKIQKWGNSLALRIPRLVAERAGLHEGSVVELTGQGGKLVVQKPRISIDEMIEKITPETLHGETDWGEPRGNEVW
jgi:antitoxin MazE